MFEVAVIDDPAVAGVSLDPMRSRLLAALAEPGSATTLAARVGLPRQKVNYHLRELERHGLVELVEALDAEFDVGGPRRGVESAARGLDGGFRLGDTGIRGVADELTRRGVERREGLLGRDELPVDEQALVHLGPGLGLHGLLR